MPPGASGATGMGAVRSLLAFCRLEQYGDSMEETGYDDLDWILSLDADGFRALAQAVGMKPGHLLKLQSYVSQYAPPP